MTTIDAELDTSGLSCPLPILKAKKALAGLRGGQVLRVIASDPVAMRREKAQSLGAEWVVDPQATDLAAFVQEVTDGWGVDAVALTVGSARMVEACIKLLAPGGRLNIFAGIYPKDQISLDPNQIHYGEWIITGSADSTPDPPGAIT